MAKPNAYTMFVKEEARRRQMNGSNVNFNSLYQELDQKWRSLSEAEKQKYKDRASRSNQHNATTSFSPQNSQASPQQSQSLSQQQPTPTNPASSLELVPLTADSSSSPKTIAPADNSVALVKKRPHDGWDLTPQVHEKRLKPGIPSWRLKSDTCIVDPSKEYKDYYLLNMRNQCESIVRARERTLVTLPIYGFSANIMCKQDKAAAEGQDIYIPIEVSLFAYSVKNGRVGKPYHVMIDAGKIPNGCVNKSIDHAVYHKIKLPNFGGYPEGARSDYKKIYKEMLNYTKDGERTILIADHRDLKQVKGCLEWIYRKASEDGSKQPKVSTWTVLTVTEFVAAMYNHVHQYMLYNEMPMFAIHYFIRLRLDINSFLDYNSTLMCEYHAKEENSSKWCARSCAMRTLLNVENILESIHEHYKYAVGGFLEIPAIQARPNLPQIAPAPTN